MKFNEAIKDRINEAIDARSDEALAKDTEKAITEINKILTKYKVGLFQDYDALYADEIKGSDQIKYSIMLEGKIRTYGFYTDIDGEQINTKEIK